MNVDFSMDDGRCLLDVINDPSALDQFMVAPEDGQLPEDAFGLDNLQPSITTTGPTLTSTSYLGAATTVSHPVQQNVSLTPSLNTTVTSNLGMTLGVPTTNITVVPGSSPQIFQQIPSTTPISRDASPAPQLNQNVTQQQQFIIQSQQNVQQIQNLQTGQVFGSPQQQQLLRQTVLQQRNQPQQGTVKQVAIQPQTAVMTGNSAQNLGGIQIRPQGQVSSGPNQVNVQGTLIQTSTGNKLLIQGQPLAGQQLNLAQLQGLQVQQNPVQLQQQQQQTGSTSAVSSSVNQQSNIQLGKNATTSQNVNVLNLNQLNTQGQQQILIQRPVQGGPNQNIILKTIPGSNMLQIQQNASNSGSQANQTITLGGQQLVVAPQNQVQPPTSQIQSQTPAQSQAPVLSGLPAGINIINNLQNVNVMAASQGQLVATPNTSTSSQKVQGPNVTLNINGQNMTIPLQQLQALQQLNKGVNIVGQQTQTQQNVQAAQSVAVAQPNMLGAAQVMQTQTGQQLIVGSGAVLKNAGTGSVQNTIVQNSQVVSATASVAGNTKVPSDPVAQKLQYEQALLVQKPPRQVQPLTSSAQVNAGAGRTGQVNTSNLSQTAHNIISQNQTLAQVQKLQLSTSTTAQTNQSGVGIVNQNTVQLQQSSVKIGTVHGAQSTVQWGQNMTQQQNTSNQISGLHQSQNTNDTISRQLQNSTGSSSQGQTQFMNAANTQPVQNQVEDKALPSSAIQLTPSNQVLLQKIQQQLKTLQALPNRNEQQEKWLQQLSDAQRKLLIQGRVQAIKNHEQQKLLRQQKLQEKVAQVPKSHPIVQTQQQPQQQIVQQVKPVNTPVQPNTTTLAGMQANSASNNKTVMHSQQGQISNVQNIPQVQIKHHQDVNKQSGGTVQNTASMQILQTAGQQNLNALLNKQGKPAQVNLISSTSAGHNTQKVTMNTTTAPSLNSGVVATGLNSNANASPTVPTTNPVKVLNQLQLPQAVQEKLQAQLAKMTPEQQKLFYKHQPLLLLKLQQQQQNLMQQKQQTLTSMPQSIPLTVQQVAGSSSNQLLTKTTQSAAQPSASITTARLPLKRPAQTINKVVFIQSQLNRDQNGALHPDCKTAFKNNKDACKRLLRYHVFQSKLPSEKEFETVDNMFEDVAQGLLDKKTDMLNKYQKLLLDDSRRNDPTAEMVMLERIFLNDERKQLLRDRDLVKTDPDSFTPCPIIKEEPKPETSDSSDEGETETKKIKTEEDSESNVKGGPTGSNKYTLHASGGLKIVIKNSPANSPADSPKSNNGVEIKTEVKTESQQADENEEELMRKSKSNLTPGIKKEPVDSGEKHSNSSRELNVSETLNDGNKISEVFSETDAAVAGLMSSTGMSDSEMFSDLSQDESNIDYELNSSKEYQDNSKDLTYNDTDEIIGSPMKKRKIAQKNESDNSMIFSDNEHDLTGQQGEIDSAVDGLLADLGPDPSPLSHVGDGDWPNDYESQKCFNGDLGESSQSDTEMVSKVKKQGQSDTEETGSLQFEMESAINSILSLQQATGGNGTSQQKSDNNGLSYDETPIDQEDDLDAAIQSIL